MIENIEQIRQAIEVEQKNQYIDIRGRHDTFSGFILKQLHNLYKKSKKYHNNFLRNALNTFVQE